jgi:uncharacterized protein
LAWTSNKATISISVAEEGRSGPVRFIGVIPNTPEAVHKMAKQLARHGELDFCYEASGCGYMLLGGLPGVLVGSLGLKHLVTTGSQNLINALLGAILVGTASWQIFTLMKPMRWNPRIVDRSRLLPWLMLPVGAEVGFSSAGAGALGSAALLSLTPLLPAQVVGTDIAFGFLLSLIGSGAHWFSTSADPALLTHLIVGGVAGAISGTLVGSVIPRRPLRFALWVWLLVLGGQFLVHSYQAVAVAH